MTGASGRTLTVGELRAQLAHLPDDTPITLDGGDVTDLSEITGSVVDVVSGHQDEITVLVDALGLIANAERSMTRAKMVETAKEALS